MTQNFYHTPFPMQEIPVPTFPAHNVSSSDYSSVQEAVNACAAAGGGTVTVPAGVWQTGPIHLKSNIRLTLKKGAILQFSANPTDYLPVVFTRWEGFECYNYSPLLYANGCENIAVTGEGILEGNGASWWHWKELQAAASDALYAAAIRNTPVEQRVFGTPQAALRPSFLQFLHCSRVLVEGVCFADGPQWTVHPVYCEDVTIRGIKVYTGGHNTDGLNPDSCKNVLIEQCDFVTGDDCIALNAGMNEDGWRVNRPCENIVIRHCTMRGGHGGLVIGSAVSGGVKNVYAHDCSISQTMQGLRIKSMRGRGGFVKNILFETITINDVSDSAIQVSMFYPYSTVAPSTQTPSDFKEITIRNVHGTGAKTALELRGLPEKKIVALTLETICLAASDTIICADVQDLRCENVRLTQA